MKEKRNAKLLENLNYYSDTFGGIFSISPESVSEIGTIIISSILNYRISIIFIGSNGNRPEVLSSMGIPEEKIYLLNSKDGLIEYLWNKTDAPYIYEACNLENQCRTLTDKLGLGEFFLTAPLKSLKNDLENIQGLIIAADPHSDYEASTDIAVLEIIASFITGALNNLNTRMELLRTNESLTLEITERKKIEEKLRLSEKEYRTIFENTGTATVIIEEDTKISLANVEAEKLVGCSNAEIQGKSWTEFIVDEEIEKLRGYQHLRKEAPERVPRSYETRIRDSCGNIKDVFVTAAMIPETDRRMVSIIDITERRQKEKELESIAKVSNALRSAASRTDMIPVILEQVLYLLKSDGAAIAIRDTCTGEILIELSKGEWKNWTGLRLAPGEGISGYVIQNSKPYHSNNITNDPLLAKPDIIGQVQAVCCVPLIAQNHTLGALWIGRKTAITPEEVRLLTSISDIAANAIYRSTLYEQTECRMQKLAALRSIDMAITSSLDLHVTLNVLLDQVTTHLQVDAATVLLLNPYTKMLEYSVGRGFRSLMIKQTKLRLGEGHAGVSALERRIISIPNVLQSDDPCVRTQMLSGELFIAHHAAPLIAKGQVMGVMEVFNRSQLRPEPEWLEFFEALAAQAAIAIDNARLFDELQRSNTEISLAYDSTLEGWTHALDMRDKETEGHTIRVAEMTVKLARALGLSESEIVHIRRGALLHDIGKIAVPDTILHKQGPLTIEDYETIMKHPIYAYKMLSPIAYLRQSLNIPYCHHEKWDGTGYPNAFKGEQIPFEARIFAVVDVWDALRSDRPYRKAWSKEKALQYIIENSGKHFEPGIVEVFLKIIN